jgi:hypothetical protein
VKIIGVIMNKVRVEIDREKLRVAIRKLDEEYVYYLLNDAIDLLPQSKLAKLIRPYLNPDKVRKEGVKKQRVLDEVKAFREASLRGDYYEEFFVDSKNYMNKSRGTQAWFSECNRLLNRCVAQTKNANPSETREAFEIIFELLRLIDEGYEIVFFANEGGSWQLGADWIVVLAAWFKCLSKTAEPEEYARLVVDVVDRFEKSDRDKHLATALRVANPTQRKALRGA